MERLQFGLNDVAPRDAKALWGARAIVEDMPRKPVKRKKTKNADRDHYLRFNPPPAEKTFSLLWNRQDWKGDPEEIAKLKKKLTVKRIEAAQKGFREKIRDGYDPMGDAYAILLYWKDGLLIYGNARQSHGYLYLCAFLEQEKQSDLPPA